MLLAPLGAVAVIALTLEFMDTCSHSVRKHDTVGLSFEINGGRFPMCEQSYLPVPILEILRGSDACCCLAARLPCSGNNSKPIASS